jgi:hypothetical protein
MRKQVRSVGDIPIKVSREQSWLLDAACVVVAAALVLFFIAAAGFTLWSVFRNVVK